MQQRQTVEQLTSELGEAIKSGSLPTSYQNWGRRLLDHLMEPVQVIFIGPAGAGKSSLVNMILGRNVIGGMEGTPEIHVVFGREERALIEFYDGRTEWHDGLLSGISFDEPVARACQELPDETLAQQSLVEIGLPQDPIKARPVLEKAAESADILLWCSRDFGPAEQDLWAALRDREKDHGHLVLTMADKLMMRGKLDGRIAELEPIVAEEFLGLYPIATLQGLSAMTSGDGKKDPLWTSSGGRKLAEDLARQIDIGRSADIDQARMILGQRANARGSSQPTAKARNKPKSAPRQRNKAITEALELLRRSGQEMLDRIEEGAPGTKPRDITEYCTSAMRQMSEILSKIPSSGEIGVATEELLGEGEEMLLLVQQERGEIAAEDAVTVLLQVRNELSALETG